MLGSEITSQETMQENSGPSGPSCKTPPVAASTSSLSKQFIMLFIHVGKRSN